MRVTSPAYPQRGPHTTRQTIVCPHCKGVGKLWTERTRDSHGNAYTCVTCDGERVVEEIKTITLKSVKT